MKHKTGPHTSTYRPIYRSGTGTPAHQTSKLLAPTNLFDTFWRHLRLMYSRMSQVGVQTGKKICSHRPHSIVLYLHSEKKVATRGAARNYDG